MLLLTSKGLVNKTQVRGALGIAWRPIADIPEGADPRGPYSNGPRQACTALMEKGSGTVQGRTMPTALAFCTDMNAIKGQYDKLGGRLTGPALVAGLETLGSSFVGAITQATYLARGRHDGLAAYFNYAFVDSCGCMSYIGGPRRLPA
jgi:hypothetical protein